MPLLVKFPTREDGDDAGVVEMAYVQMARLAGIQVPPTRLFSTRKGLRCFSVERFDRVGGLRRHVHTLGGLLHASHRECACTYTEYLKTVYALTRDVREVHQAFRRMLFNVVSNNRDDHVKNFAFMMEPDGTWHLTPTYDLTYAAGPGGEHSMMIGTEGRRPTFRNLVQVGDTVDLSRRDVSAMLEEVIYGL